MWEQILALEARDWLIVLATMLGPILAVQAQKRIEILRERRNHKRWVFLTLMTTRGVRLSNEHVQALNMIDLAFYGTKIFRLRWQSPSERAVTTAWKEYRSNLGEHRQTEAEWQTVYAARDVLFTSLLEALSKSLGYNFDRVQLAKDAYHPTGHEEIENEQRALRRLGIRVMAGEIPVKMELTKVPPDGGAAALRAELTKALSGEGAIHVQIRDGEGAPRNDA